MKIKTYAFYKTIHKNCTLRVELVQKVHDENGNLLSGKRTTLTAELPMAAYKNIPFCKAYLDVKNNPTAEALIDHFALAKHCGTSVTVGGTEYPLYKFDLNKLSALLR